MAKVSAKRQISLPIEQCAQAHINVGDEVECYVDREGVISVVRKSAGAAKGVLSHIQVKENMTDEESMRSALGS
ncbi:AbrB/MazE/SpoVT family DNA-binding domain-containing protein [Paraneptunicella aestuarii]|uniref:AbrB/MazE/SpoVT family DNA-binding domain-containing protein n=1 Tax=Paraneptunicella aestuarii TaxID=2831148 RepID=UPI001E347804|nr:AbrB/MazE/SpoVT family DNA-binding domain-containing protein [Paraneptunicella aestuarii]UAA39549.1 AbrB/MazE/SpoVT family DNA-binding domain-containing protein [Paraneptunicella aestuarii]